MFLLTYIIQGYKCVYNIFLYNISLFLPHSIVNILQLFGVAVSLFPSVNYLVIECEGAESHRLNYHSVIREYTVISCGAYAYCLLSGDSRMSNGEVIGYIHTCIHVYIYVYVYVWESTHPCILVENEQREVTYNMRVLSFVNCLIYKTPFLPLLFLNFFFFFVYLSLL